MAGRHRRISRSGRGRHRGQPRRSDLVLPSVAAVAVLSLGGVGASAAFNNSDDVHALRRPHPVPTLALPPAASPTPHAATSAVAATTPATNAPRPATNAPTRWFSVTTTGGLAWVEVVAAHGKVLYAGLLRHGRTVSFSQRPLHVTLGDAGAVRLVEHHHVKDPAGKHGAVLRFVAR